MAWVARRGHPREGLTPSHGAAIRFSLLRGRSNCKPVSEQSSGRGVPSPAGGPSGGAEGGASLLAFMEIRLPGAEQHAPSIGSPTHRHPSVHTSLPLCGSAPFVPGGSCSAFVPRAPPPPAELAHMLCRLRPSHHLALWEHPGAWGCGVALLVHYGL